MLVFSFVLLSVITLVSVKIYENLTEPFNEEALSHVSQSVLMSYKFFFL